MDRNREVRGCNESEDHRFPTNQSLRSSGILEILVYGFQVTGKFSSVVICIIKVLGKNIVRFIIVDTIL